jgi:histidine ammonia-lyase
VTIERLHPGRVSLAQWQRIYRGAGVEIDAGCRAAIRAGAEAVTRIVEKG